MGGGETLNYCVRHSRDALTALSGVVGFSPLVQQTNPASKLARSAGGLLGVALPNFTIPAPISYEVCPSVVFSTMYSSGLGIGPLA